MSMHKKIAHGVFWALLEKLGQQGLSFIVFLILARILGPAQFGMVNLCYVYITISYFIISGAMDGIVALQIRDDLRLSTMFWTVMGIGGVMALFCLATAVPFATVMKHAQIASLLSWIAVIPVLIAAQAVPYALVMKSMDFRVFTIRTIIANIAGGATGIVLALRGFGPYSLVAQQIVMYLATNLVTWPGCGWRPRLMFDRHILGSVMGPGFRTGSSYFLDFFDQQAPRIIVGSFIGVVAVGHYSLVTRIRQAIYDVLIHPLAVVLYPAFSEIKDDAPAQQKVLGQIISIVGVLIFPAIVGAASLADLYVPVFFGPAWIPAVPVLQLLLLTGTTLPFVVILRDVMRAHNKTGPYLRVQIFLVIANLALAAFLSRYGLVTMSFGWVAISAIALLSYVGVLKSCTGLNLWPDFLRLLLPITGSALIAALIAVFNHAGWHPANIYLLMLSDVVLGVAVYAVYVPVVMRREMALLLGMVSKLRRRKTAAVVVTTP